MEYYYLVLKRKWEIGISFFLVVIVSLVYVLLLTPIYQSDVKILVSDASKGSALASLLNVQDMMAAGTMGKSDPVVTQMELIKTRPILDRVIQLLKLKDSSEEAFLADEFKKGVLVSSIRNTNIIKISYKDKDKDLARDIANTIATVFVANNREVNQEESRRARLFIEKQLSIRKASLEGSQDLMLAYQKEAGTVSLGKETELYVMQLTSMRTEQINKNAEYQAVKANILNLDKQLSQIGPGASPFVPQWKQELNSLNFKKDTLEANLVSLKSEIKKLEISIKKLPPKEVKLARLMAAVEIEKEIYSGLLLQLEETKIAEAAQIAAVRVIEPAIAGNRPVFPQKRKTMMLAIIAGLALGFGIALLLEYFDQSISNMDDIDSITKWNRLGVIPMRDTKDVINDPIEELIMVSDPNSPLAESYRSLRTNIHFANVDKPIKTLLVTSSIPGEGKTTVSANIAISHAMLGKKVLLIDCDFRKPRIHKIFNLKNNRGLTNILTGDMTMSQVIRTEKLVENLHILSCGPIPPNPSELLASNAMKTLLTKLSEKFDMIILDTPPLIAVSDATVLIPEVDGYIVVSDINRIERPMLEQSKTIATRIKHEPLGYVVNKLAISKNGYYGKYSYGQYRYYQYNYGEDKG